MIIPDKPISKLEFKGNFIMYLFVTFGSILLSLVLVFLLSLLSIRLVGIFGIFYSPILIAIFSVFPVYTQIKYFISNTYTVQVSEIDSPLPSSIRNLANSSNSIDYKNIQTYIQNNKVLLLTLAVIFLVIVSLSWVIIAQPFASK